MCVNFGAKILLRGEECKTRVNLNFFKKWKKIVNFRYSKCYKPGIFFISDDETDLTIGFFL